jgi:hypothetical protein
MTVLQWGTSVHPPHQIGHENTAIGWSFFVAEADSGFDTSGEGSSHECGGLLGGRLVDSVLMECTIPRLRLLIWVCLFVK